MKLERGPSTATKQVWYLQPVSQDVVGEDERIYEAMLRYSKYRRKQKRKLPLERRDDE